MEIGTKGEIRRRFDDDDTTTKLLLQDSSTPHGTSLAERLDRRTGYRTESNALGVTGNEGSLRLRGKSSLRIFTLMQIFLITTFAFVYFLNEDIYFKLENNKCKLLYGDKILRRRDVYSIHHLDGHALFTRRENETILFPDSCTTNATVTDENGDQHTFRCISQSFLFKDNRPYYAFRLFRRTPHFDAASKENDNDNESKVLVQGPFSTNCGDWMNATDCSHVQLVIRTDLDSGLVTLGYPPIPMRRELGSEKVAFYVDGSAMVMTSLDS